MNIRVEPGVWVVAVSGGVDSMALLHALHAYANASAGHDQPVKLIVAHFDHGIRSDSRADRLLVQQTAKAYGLPFVYEAVRLGPDASEATARHARYEFLEKVRATSGARGIITAHHQDDALETAIHNLLRGTGRRGMTALKHTPGVQRPLLAMSKARLRDYARSNGLVWHEDSTNTDTKYMRNYIRHKLLTKFSPAQRAQLAILVEDMRRTNYELDTLLINQLHMQPRHDTLAKRWFVHLPHAVAGEVVHTWLRAHDAQDISRKTIERLVVAMKTGKVGQRFPVDKQWCIAIESTTLALRPLER